MEPVAPSPAPPSPTRPRPGSWPLRALRVLVEIFLATLILVDELARPLYRPLARWIASLRLVARTEVAIARMPRLAVLMLLALPLAIAEPLKIVGLFMIGRGQLMLGGIVLGLAYLASFLIVERIYHAGRTQLLSYGWLAWSIGHVVRLRTGMLNLVTSSSVWQFIKTSRKSMRTPTADIAPLKLVCRGQSDALREVESQKSQVE